VVFQCSESAWVFNMLSARQSHGLRPVGYLQLRQPMGFLNKLHLSWFL